MPALSFCTDMLRNEAPERYLAASYAAGGRGALIALFALDLELGKVLRATREPMIGRIKLAWWREALEALDTAPAPDQPVLKALAETLRGKPGSGARLAEMEDGWAALLDEPLDEKALALHATARGATLFGEVAEEARRAGEGWALVDVALHLSDPDARARAFALARQRLSGLLLRSLPAALRGLVLVAQREAVRENLIAGWRRPLLQIRGSLLGC